ncbi:zinc-binding alcohol dehydrogenase [Pontimonas sp.]|uniref:zinc-dependent alcohol dehydrogenase n=1 Tax=Pontimonas sp. TaxID=2304492 RepID=UPI00286FF3A4|nr:zinc-binding alcohol dehydrogenase [Pontimonas sp.]MDR9435155.1 zinc-binding alcohol dehydrogenase [Pontimonas sp.]
MTERDVAASALWCVGPQHAELREADLGEGVLVETLYSGISRGTERLVFGGAVPESEFVRMRGPAQEGDFPFPVKYGYSAVGAVAEGERTGQLVFALHPHQTSFRLPEHMLTPLPDALPAERAVLAANMETALNILWDSNAGAGDRIGIVGAGVVGALVGYLAAKLPGSEVTLVDTNQDRAALAHTLGCHFASPADALESCDVVVHTSASQAGLHTALALAGQEATVVEASWHGSALVEVPLGGAFHSKRLKLVSSQVGQLPTSRTPRWNHARRLTTALELLRDPILDTLITGESTLSQLPGEYGTILNDPATLCHRVAYPTS